MIPRTRSHIKLVDPNVEQPPKPEFETIEVTDLDISVDGAEKIRLTLFPEDEVKDNEDENMIIVLHSAGGVIIEITRSRIVVRTSRVRQHKRELKPQMPARLAEVTGEPADPGPQAQ